MPISFFETVMGHRFYEGDVPNIRRALEEIQRSLLSLTEAVNRLAYAEERRLHAETLRSDR